MALLRGSNSNSNSETRPLGAPSAGSSCLGPILHSRSLLPAAVRSTAGPCLHGVLASPQTDLPQGSQVILGRTVHRNKPPPQPPYPPAPPQTVSLGHLCRGRNTTTCLCRCPVSHLKQGQRRAGAFTGNSFYHTEAKNPDASEANASPSPKSSSPQEMRDSAPVKQNLGAVTRV